MDKYSALVKARATRDANRPTLQVRFWSKVIITDKENCWEWTRYTQNKTKKEYGDFRINGKTIRTHRVAWMLTYGDIPQGFLVCHKCDNPKCCNPNHLFLGTAKQNSADMVSKNRQARGHKSAMAKLTENQALQIYAMKPHYPQRGFSSFLGRLYNVSKTCVEHIWRGSTWSHISQGGTSAEI